MTATRGAYRELILNINGKNTTLHGAFHMDKAPMTLLVVQGVATSDAPAGLHDTERGPGAVDWRN
jgi:hypothetical protein